MLKSLYDYGIQHKLTLPPGYQNKTVKAYIWLNEDGKLIGIYLEDESKSIPCPDIGSLANGKDKSNVLVEKRSVVIPEKENTPKSEFFLNALKLGAEYEPLLGICAQALENRETADAIRAELTKNAIKPSDRISFRVGDCFLPESEYVAEWWKEYRKQFQTGNASDTSLCMIQGTPVIPMTTTTPIVGLKTVGGHARGDALICFDKSAFCSYGLKKAANAPVSEEAFGAVKAALDDLLKQAPTEAGAKFVHWYDSDVKAEEDPIVVFGDFGDYGSSFDDDTEETPEEKEEKERSAREKADKLIQSIRSGQSPVFPECRYHILILSGVGGRIMVRHYECGSYKSLAEKLDLWREDLKLVNSAGTADLISCKLTRRLIVLLKYMKRDNKVFQRMDKELSGVTPTIIQSILNGTPLPDTVASRALANIRSQMLSASEDDGTSSTIPDPRACQWLKIWLIRRNREKNREEFLMNTYNMQHPEPAYHCGGLMAVFARIQERAMEGVNAGVVQRYYASASRTPALVIGRLSSLSNYHLDKIEHSGYLKRYLEELYAALGNSVPVSLTLEQQSYFALGYYQMCAKMNEDARAAREQKDKKTAENENKVEE